MAEIKYDKFNNYLQKLDKGGFIPVYLIFGEEFLYKTAFEKLLDILMPPSTRGLNYESLDGTDENITKALQSINTYAFLSGTKIVALRDTQVFYSKVNKKTLLEKAKKEYDNNNIKKAAKYFLSLLSLLNLSLNDTNKENMALALKLDFDQSDDDGWFDKVADYCKAAKLKASNTEDKAKLLQMAIEKGFPQNNYLIITADMVDKRKGLYKAVNKFGMIVDCSVPKGERAADKNAQQKVLFESMETVLIKNKKKMDKDAVGAMLEMTGFDLRAFLNNLEKLISYTGERNRITLDDVKLVLKRTKKDPIFEFTNAISDRNLEKALFFLNSLLPQVDHPLQLLAAITNQVRKLLLIKGFVESRHGRSWHAGINFNQFQKDVMPGIKEYDNDILNSLKEWEGMLSENKKTAKNKLSTDLLVAQNPNNPYPIYKMLLKSGNFTTNELFEFFEHLGEADLQFKSVGGSPKIILEKIIFHICGNFTVLPGSSERM